MRRQVVVGTGVLVAAVAAVLLGVPAQARQKSVSAAAAWVKVPDAGANIALAFAALDNPTMYDAYVMSASSDASEGVEFRDAQENASSPRVVKSLTIPAYGELRMKPDGLHLALLRVTRPLKAGDTVVLTFTDDVGQKFEARATVSDRAP